MIYCIPRAVTLKGLRSNQRCWKVIYSDGSTKLFLKSKHPSFGTYFGPWKREMREGLEPSEGLKAFLRGCI